MREKTTEIWVGLLMLLGVLALLILALKVSGLSENFNNGGYLITANFDNVGELKPRARIAMAGVRVGQVVGITLDQNTFKATVTMRINSNADKIPTDSSANIMTEGLLGSNYVSLIPGYADTFLKEGDKIENTRPALILENLIGQFLFSVKNSGENNKQKVQTQTSEH